MSRRPALCFAHLARLTAIFLGAVTLAIVGYVCLAFELPGAELALHLTVLGLLFAAAILCFSLAIRSLNAETRP